MATFAPQKPAPAAWRARIRPAGREILATALIMFVYFLLRGLRPADVDGSVGRSLALIRFEQQLGLFREAEWQAAFIGHGWAMTLANWVYAWGHYPVMLAIAIWLVLKDPVRFRFVRNVMLVSATIGVISYWLIPAAPPRLMEINGYDFGFIDTVQGTTAGGVEPVAQQAGGALKQPKYFQPALFVNDYAALPSFHFGWILLSSLAVWFNTHSRIVRAGAVAMSLLMWWAVTVTGNHYFFDMALGGVVVVLSWMFVDAMGDVRLRDVRRRLIPLRRRSGA